jgi:heme exporter protein A
LRLLSTLINPSSGKATILGFDLQEQADKIRGALGLISHQPMLYMDLTAEENLVIAAKLYGVSKPEQRARELLALVELTARRHDVVRGFSRGMTQRLSIARALVHSPQLLLLDEPYSGLDPHAVQILDNIIAQMRSDAAKQYSFCMVSHDLEKGIAMATHLLLLERGKVAEFCLNEASAAERFTLKYREATGAF